MKKVPVVVASFMLFGGVSQARLSKKESAYAVDTRNSKLVWVGKKVTGEHTGLVPITNGSLVWADNKLKGGNFDIDVKNLTVTDITDASYNEKLVGHLKNDDFFAVAKYPKASFVISSVTPKGANNYEIVGKLTIKGITQEVRFPAVVKAEKSLLTAQAKINVDRTKFDIRYRSSNFFENLGDKAIENDFTLDVNLVANASSVTKL
ncbi:YceI family protein [Runella limosa]|uniref:YceI family protein n=1 Tax=Runella limosa TaxID=370978 RepID=UPI00040BCE27|nr:YceI family protein [Runella limosa]